MSNEFINLKPDISIASSKIVAHINENPKDASYSVILAKKENTGNFLLELKITHIAVVSPASRLNLDTIHSWLYLTGLRFVKKVDKFKTLTITSKDVVDGQLITDWTELQQN
ncbi:hypothetical protein ACQKJG_30185 [Priestia megaterium]|uniref:hypothetical protein n=1 Tax=Priestia megaterium TaxID=1404 RepID=UPI003D040C6D